MPTYKQCCNRDWESPPLVPLKQIPRVHLVRHVRELVVSVIGGDHVAVGLEGLRVVGHLGAEELRREQRGLVDHRGHTLGLHDMTSSAIENVNGRHLVLTQ